MDFYLQVLVIFMIAHSNLVINFSFNRLARDGYHNLFSLFRPRDIQFTLV